jgi:hypothetical protein
MSILLAFFLGAILGMRFKVLTLVPVIGFALIAILGGGFARGASASAILITVVLVWIFLQAGYLSGIVTRYSIAMARAGRLRKTSFPAESAR